MMFLLGRQAMLGQDPPIYFRSTTATRCPWPPKVHAASFDPTPLPIIRRSYSSGPVFLDGWVAEPFPVVFIWALLSQRLAAPSSGVSWRRAINNSKHSPLL